MLSLHYTETSLHAPLPCSKFEEPHHSGKSRPKKSRSHASKSCHSIALPEAMRKDRICGENPSPENTTSPGIGHASMSRIVVGIFSSAVPAVAWHLHSIPSRRRSVGFVNT